MPASIDKHELNPEHFVGAIKPALVQIPSGCWFFRMIKEKGVPEYVHQSIGKVTKEEAILKAPEAFLKLREKPKKGKLKRVSYDNGYVPAIDWDYYKLTRSGVYFITNDWDSIKIGRSKDIVDRLGTHQTSNPSRIHVVMLIPTDEHLQAGVEKELHQKFEDCCRIGEWFWNVPSLQEHIELLQKEYNFRPFIFGKKPKNWFI